MSFVHLHSHTEFSLLDGANKIKEYIKRVKELNMSAAAITDHGVMYGVIDFYKEAINRGIKPIIGCEVYLVKKGKCTQKTSGYYHLILLCENNEGYENLTKIVSKGFVDGFYYKPRVDKEILKKYSKGIIASSACLQGEIPYYLINDDYEKAKCVALEYLDIFGENNFYLELQNHGIKLQEKVNQYLMRLSADTNIPLIATNDVHYTYKEDYKAHDVLICLQTGKHLSDKDRMRYEKEQFYVRSEDEMKQLFPYAIEAIENTSKIADRCNVEIKFHEKRLPKFEVPPNVNSYEYLQNLCRDGIKKRYKNSDIDELNKRLNYELKVIYDMGFVDYFLIVWDFIKFAKENAIMVGPGRGSAAGSIVAYSLFITDVDPIKYNLVFERFLNPHRVSMPDIDVDFCFERRLEVIDYVIKKYGIDKVVQIITFGTMAARAVIRDVGRVMNLPYAFVDKIAKMIPTELNITIDKAIIMNPQLGELILNDERVADLISMSKKLEGMPRHSSVHAAGVVICSSKASNLIPLSRASDGTITTQFTMTTVEELGLLKMDFLGLRTLSVIQNAVDAANIDIKTIDIQKKEVYDMISNGATDGVFQLESSGMKSFLKELKPKCFEDIVAGISLYRPGPMDFIPKYIEGKNNPDSIKYHCEQLKDILKNTYGCIVYQEQVMQIVQKLAGYSLGRSDILRRAMSKKKSDVMNRERQNFVYGNEKEGIMGCVNNGIKEEIANKIFDEMIDFAKYAFNKSHSVAYSILSYRTAYLRCFYKVEFMAALLSSIIDNPNKTIAYLYSCKQMEIEVIPPNINISGKGFKVKNGKIIYALNAIKTVGSNVAKNIEDERAKNGIFLNFNNFIERTQNCGINKKAIESLIKSGALDGLNMNRHTMIEGFISIMEDIQNNKKDKMTGQGSLFDLPSFNEDEKIINKIKYYDEYTKQQLLEDEKEVLGLYVSGHPLNAYEKIIGLNSNILAIDFEAPSVEDNFKMNDKQKVQICGMITEVKKIYTKNNKQMAFLYLEDLTGTIEIIAFPEILNKYDSILYEYNKILVVGNFSIEDEKKSAKLIMERAFLIDEIPKVMYIEFLDKKSYDIYDEHIKYLAKKSHGNDELIIFLRNPRSIKIISKKIDATDNSEFLEKMRNDFGEKRVKVIYKKFC